MEQVFWNKLWLMCCPFSRLRIRELPTTPRTPARQLHCRTAVPMALKNLVQKVSTPDHPDVLSLLSFQFSYVVYYHKAHAITSSSCILVCSWHRSSHSSLPMDWTDCLLWTGIQNTWDGQSLSTHKETRTGMRKKEAALDCWGHSIYLDRPTPL